MRSYLIVVASFVLLSTQTGFAQPGYDNRDPRQNYNDGRDNVPYEAYRGDYQPAGDRYGRSYGDDCRSQQQNKQLAGTAIGAVAGGVLGNQVAGRGSRTGGTIAGVLLGAVAGNLLTRDVDCGDRYYAEPVYQRGLEGPIGQRHTWRNDRDRDRGQFTPTREYQRDNYTCRDYTTNTYRDGRQMRRNGSACRYEDGSWYFQ